MTGSGGVETPVRVTLTQEKIILTSRPQRKVGKCIGKSEDVTEILSSDIVSVRPPYHGDNSRHSKKKKSLLPVLLVVAYPRHGNIREKKSFFFQLTGRREEVHQLSQIWVTAVSDICLGLQRSSMSPLYSMLPASQPLLVLINPASGKGEAMRCWHKAKSVLSEAGRLAEVIVTEGQGHASQIMSSLELSLWAGVVTVSGDGLIHEVYNGLLARPDWRSALQFSVGVLPGGSGNALVHTLAASQVMTMMMMIRVEPIIKKFKIFLGGKTVVTIYRIKAKFVDVIGFLYISKCSELTIFGVKVTLMSIDPKFSCLASRILQFLIIYPNKFIDL